ncbi:hypothetical protein GUY40_15175 [Pseudomonas sp. R5(2019)]|nr:hypothetical protein [Pseudomonas sp. R5(2019)]NBA96276.1 hypothetical protein [Pseudomonas sp. R5(2019)]
MIGGMLTATLAVVFVPVFFVVMTRLTGKRRNIVQSVVPEQNQGCFAAHRGQVRSYIPRANIAQAVVGADLAAMEREAAPVTLNQP